MRWDQLVHMLGDAPAAFADYDGFHLGQVPDAAPPYTHLWSWTDDWLLRARIDGENVIVGTLALTGEPEHSEPPIIRENVRYERVTAKTWQQNEKRVGRLHPGITDRPVDVYLIAGERPVTFLAAGSPE
jgi:sugar phosphate isomerase/epimerase